jgi:transcriptional regulator with XRE-family HTH domain
MRSDQHLKKLSAVSGQVAKIFKFADKDYRDGYLFTRVRSGIAYQIQALRKSRRLSQTEMAEIFGKKQSVISRLENTQYGKVTVQTLLEIASRLNVALLVQFVSYPEFLSKSSDMSDRTLLPDTIEESLQKEFLRMEQSVRTSSVNQLRETASATASIHTEWNQSPMTSISRRIDRRVAHYQGTQSRQSAANSRGVYAQ